MTRNPVPEEMTKTQKTGIKITEPKDGKQEAQARVQITLGDLLDRMAERYPDQEALVYPAEGRRLTYRELRAEADRVARALLRLGVKPGEHIAVWTTNRPEWVSAFFGIGKAGAALVTVNVHYRTMELEYLLRHSDATTLVLIEGFRDASYPEMLYELCPELREAAPGKLRAARLPHLRNVIYIGERHYPGMFTWEEFLALGEETSPEERAARQATVTPQDIVTLMYTSGTTGLPKGVMLSHLNIVANGTYIGDCMKFSPDDRLCIPVPFFHCFGSVLGVMASVTHAVTMVVVDYFHAREVMEVVTQERCTALHGVPTMFIAILTHPDFPRFKFQTLRTGIMAGSPCPVETMRAVIEKMGMREITIAYGQTEASPVITQSRTDDPLEIRVKTVGRALPQVEVKIVDMFSGREVPPGVQGEICTRGSHVMRGYYKDPEATRAVIDEEGWLHTGDLGVMDERGYLHITGRMKDMIIRGGENIYPRELEEFLHTHPKVMDAQVVGVPSKKYGEEVMAFVRLNPGAEATEEELRAYFEGKISHFKIPRYIKFVEEYPMTASGKVQKYKLREIAIRELNLEEEAAGETA